MAEQADLHTADIRGEEPDKDPVSASDEETQKEPEKSLNVKQQEEDTASSPASTHRETKKDDDEDMRQADGENDDSAEKMKVPVESKEFSSPDEPVKDNSSPPQAVERSHGDFSGVTQGNNQPTMKDDNLSGEIHTEERNEPKIPTLLTLGAGMDQVDGPNATLGEETPGKNNEAGEGERHRKENKEQGRPHPLTQGGRVDQVDRPGATLVEDTDTNTEAGERKSPQPTPPPTPGEEKNDPVGKPDPRRTEETLGTKNTDNEAGEDERSGLNTEADRTSPQSVLSQEVSDEQKKKVEIIGRTIEEPTQPGSPGGNRGFLLALGVGLVVVAILVQHFLQPESPPPKDNMRKVDIFLRQLDKLKTQFPNQRAELWTRSKIHLLRHLQTAQPTEPVSLLLTAGVRAEQTLRCLAQGLASAFSSALNASTLHIDGATKASQDSDQVKLDIDSKLQGAFEGDKPVAVIHRFEELPPGSTLIFYRYCDHEHAAYKETCLIFTVLLGEEEEIPAKSHLSTVEEMVDDHLQKKFLSDGHPVSFDRMDLDKYGGLWSRISHLILPVAAEERVEHKGC